MDKQPNQTTKKTVKPKPKAPAVPQQSQMGMFDEFAIPQPVLNAGSIDGQADALQRMGLTQQQKTVANLGQLHGNSYVQRLVGTIHTNQQTPPAQRTTTTSSLTVQPKLTVNEPNDQFEVEADRVADQVMKMPSSAPPPPVDNNEDNNNQTAVTPIKISRVQASGDAGGQVSTDVENRINRMQGSGSPLPDDTRNFFEDRMGADFSNVRIHTDSNAIQTSRDIQARAFTVGNNIAFNSGEYSPGTDSGKHLLAHELTHTLQQGGAVQAQRKPTSDEGVCPVCGKIGKAGSSCSGCGQTFAPIQRTPLQQGQSYQIQRSLSEDEGVCPTCGKIGKLGTSCSGCGKTFAPIQRMPLDPNQHFQETLASIQDNLPTQLQDGLELGQETTPDSALSDGMGMLQEGAQASLDLVEGGMNNPEGLLDQGIDAMGGLLPEEAQTGVDLVQEGINVPQDIALSEEAQTAVDLAQTATDNPQAILDQGASAISELLGSKQTTQDQQQTAQEAQQAQTEHAQQKLEEGKNAAQDQLNQAQALQKPAESPTTDPKNNPPQATQTEQTPSTKPDLAKTDSLVSGESGGASMPDLLNGENPFPSSPQEMIASLLTDTIAATLDSIAEAIDLQNLPPAVTDMPSFGGFSISEAFEAFKESASTIEFPLADKQQTTTDSPQADTSPQGETAPPPAGATLDSGNIKTDTSTLKETAKSLLPEREITETEAKQPLPETQEIAPPAPATEEKPAITTVEKPSDLMDAKTREAEQTAVTPPQIDTQDNPAQLPQRDPQTLKTPPPPNTPDNDIAPANANNSDIDTAIEEVKAGTQSPTAIPQIQAKRPPNIQRLNLIPAWVDDALNALRGDASTKEGEVNTDGTSSDSQIRSDAETQGTAIETDGQTQGTQIETDGQTQATQLETDGQTQATQLETDGQTQGTQLETDGQTQGTQIETDGQTQATQLETDGQTQATQLEADGQTQTTQLEADQIAQGDELTSEAEAKQTEVTTEAEAQEQELNTNAETKAGELEADAALQTAQMEANLAQAESEAQAQEQEFTAEVTAGEAELTAEAEQTVATVETDWVALESEADTLMGSLDAQAGAICSEQQTNAQEFLDSLDPFIEDAQEGWQEIQAQAKEAWTAFIDFAQPALDALGEKWTQFSQWVATDVWPVLQEKVTAFAQGVGEMAKGVYDWVTEKWQWLQEAWANAQEWLSTRADAAREWITEKAEAARQWVLQKADAAREWIAGKADAANQWIAGKADAAREWIGDKADAAREWITGKADAAREWITGKADTAREWIAGKADTVNQWISTKAETANQWISGKAETANQWISGQANTAREWISGRAESISSSFQSMGQTAVSGLSSRAQNAVSSVTSGGGPIMSFFGGIVNGLISGVESVASSAVNVATSALSWGLSRVESLAQGAITFVENAGTGAVSFVSNAATSAVSFVADKATGTVSFVADKALGAVDFVENTATSAVTFVETSATSAVNFVEEKATGVVTTVENAATGAVDWVATKATGAVNTVETMATGAVNKLETAGMGAVDTVESMAQAAVELAQQAWEGIKSGWETTKGAIGASLSWLGQKAVQLGGWVKDSVIAPASQWVRDRVQDAKNYVQENFPGLVACWELYQSFTAGIQEKIYQLPVIGDVKYVIDEIIEGALMGDFLEDPNGWNILGQVLIGFVPYAGQVADIRDLIAVIDKIGRGEAGYGDLALNLIAFIPGLGDAFKAGKHLDQADEVIDVLTTLGRQVDEIPPALMDTLTNNRALRDALGQSPELLDDVLKYGPEGIDAIIQYGPEAAQIISRYGPEGLEALNKYGDDAVELYTRYGDDAAEMLQDGIRAKVPAADGHQIKVLEDGRIVRCSDCGVLKIQYADELANNPDLARRLDEIEAMDDAEEAARLAQELEQQLIDARKANIPEGAPGSPTHKAARWEEYQARGGTWDYERWSNVYESNMQKASNANRVVDSYHTELGWGSREVTIDVGGQPRRLDIADEAGMRGIEHKTGYITNNADIRSEWQRDAQLVRQGWDITWVFEGTASQPLLDALDAANIKYELRGN